MHGRILPLLFVALVLPVQADMAADLAKADDAFNKGNYRDALHYYSKYAAEGNAHAQARLALMYEKGILVRQDLERAQALYQETAQTLQQEADNAAPAASNDNTAAPTSSTIQRLPGNAEAQYRLALAHLNGQGMPKDPWRAGLLLKEASNNGHRDAQATLAAMYREGHGVERNNQLATQWYRRAAEQGHAESQYRMGLAHASGSHGAVRDEKLASDYFAQAAAQNHSAAQYHLGRSYEYGKGVEKNITQAIEWYQKSAESGDVRAQKLLGMMYRDGWKVPQNSAQAVKWLEMAANQNDKDAQVLLGMMYAEGQGVKANRERAIGWFKKAAALGDPVAIEALANMGVIKR